VLAEVLEEVGLVVVVVLVLVEVLVVEPEQ
jgi:hypothetical protein